MFKSREEQIKKVSQALLGFQPGDRVRLKVRDKRVGALSHKMLHEDSRDQLWVVFLDDYGPGPVMFRESSLELI